MEEKSAFKAVSGFGSRLLNHRAQLEGELTSMLKMEEKHGEAEVQLLNKTAEKSDLVVSQQLPECRALGQAYLDTLLLQVQATGDACAALMDALAQEPATPVLEAGRQAREEQKKNSEDRQREARAQIDKEYEAEVEEVKRHYAQLARELDCKPH